MSDGVTIEEVGQGEVLNDLILRNREAAGGELRLELQIGAETMLSALGNAGAVVSVLARKAGVVFVHLAVKLAMKV